MNPFLIVGLVAAWLVVFAMTWLGWQLLRQNGRMLLRLEELEKRIDELEFAEPEDPGLPVGNGDERVNRFGNHSLARSKIKRDGLKAGTPARTSDCHDWMGAAN